MVQLQLGNLFRDNYQVLLTDMYHTRQPPSLLPEMCDEKAGKEPLRSGNRENKWAARTRESGVGAGGAV